MANIKVRAFDKTGQITFSVNGKRRVYIVDSLMYNSTPLLLWLRDDPIKAFDLVKQRGELINRPQQPKPKFEMPKDICPNCGSQTHVAGVVCPNCGYNESFSFKKWLTTEVSTPINSTIA